MRTRRHRGVHREARQVVGPGHGVVHVRAREELPGVVVDAVLQERLADALGETAVDLAFDDHRVHDVAEVVHRHEVDDVDDAGVRVDLHFADVRTRREGEVRRVVERLLREAGFEILQGVVVRHIGRERHFAEGDGLVRVDSR